MYVVAIISAIDSHYPCLTHWRMTDVVSNFHVKRKKSNTNCTLFCRTSDIKWWMDGFPFQLILFSETMLQMWTDFARFGDPNGDPQQVKKHPVKSHLKKVHLVIMEFHTSLSLAKHAIFCSTAERNFRLEPWTDDGLRSERRYHKVNRLTKNCSPTFNLTHILESACLLLIITCHIFQTQPRGVERPDVPLGSALLANKERDPCGYCRTGYLYIFIAVDCFFILSK